MRKKPKSENLNVGCGMDIKPNWVNLDIYKFKGVDIVHNIDTLPWPFPDNAFKEILINHVLEHVEDVVKTMGEVWRISKPGAIIKIGVPYFTGLNAVKDPTHKHFFCAGTFDFFERNKLDNYFNQTTKVNFKIKSRKITYSRNRFLKIFNPLCNLNQIFYERFFAHVFPAELLEVEMEVKK